jgi:hypothetical protein
MYPPRNQVGTAPLWTAGQAAAFIAFIGAMVVAGNWVVNHDPYANARVNPSESYPALLAFCLMICRVLTCRFLSLRWPILLTLWGGLVSPSVGAWQTADLADPRIIRALIPMNATDAGRLLRRLNQAGLPSHWRRDLYEFVRTTEFGNSAPMELPTRKGRVYLASQRRWQ